MYFYIYVKAYIDLLYKIIWHTNANGCDRLNVQKAFNIVFTIFLVVTILMFAILFKLTSSIEAYESGVTVDIQDNKEPPNLWEEKNIYSVHNRDGKLLKSFENLDDAIFYGGMYENSYILEKGNENEIWHNTPKYLLYHNDKLIDKFQNYSEAVNSAKLRDNSHVYAAENQNNRRLLAWANDVEMKEIVLLEVPMFQQNPELIRGCEVTSLSMLLHYFGIAADKMTLAEQIDKDSTPYQIIDGIIYYGDPSVGFIGSMSDPTKAGYGANHIPVTKLLEKYIKSRAIDATGVEFEILYYFLSNNVPVWVITNTDLKKLDESEFYTWITPKGDTVVATNKEHSVLITGYDSQYIYINDPLYTHANRKVPKEDFIQAWEQMGKQAVTYVP